MTEQRSFHHGDHSYDYSILFLPRRRKSIAIYVRPDASIEVRAPAQASYQQVHELMQKRAEWVVHHVNRILQASPVLPHEYINGEAHYYLGQRYALQTIQADGAAQLTLSHERFVVQGRDVDAVRVKTLLLAWYKQHAYQIFATRMQHIMDGMPWVNQLPPLGVRLMRKQWGSCSSTGRININLNLVKAPYHCIDYVLAHELCHLREHNHSKSFYNLMEKYAPNWKEHKMNLDALAVELLKK